jgi:hypothetical protein
MKATIFSALIIGALCLISCKTSSQVFPKTVSIPKSTPNQTVVDTLCATDFDFNTVIGWKILSGNTAYSTFRLVSITPMSCQVVVANKNAFKIYKKFSLKIRGSDNGIPVKYDTKTLTINIY